MDRQTSTLVPPQYAGTHKEFEHTFVAAHEAEAKKMFDTARTRLLAVDAWHTLCGPGSAHFELVDAQGVRLERPPQEGDYIRIDVPGPGLQSEKGYDWVQVEEIEATMHPKMEYVGFRVRPVSNPMTPGEQIAHFFSSKSSSSFIVQRTNLRLQAQILGRNESPNTEVEGVVDKLRNAVVAIGAITGIANLQWTSLVHGLLAPQSPDASEIKPSL